MIKKVIIIASAVFALLTLTGVIIDAFSRDQIVPLSIANIFVPLTILLCLVVLLSIKTSRALQVFLFVVSALLMPASLFVLGVGLYETIKWGPPHPSETFEVLILFGFFTTVFITTLIYIIRFLRLSGQTLLIAFGLLAAMLTATGVMWYNELNSKYIRPEIMEAVSIIEKTNVVMGDEVGYSCSPPPQAYITLKQESTNEELKELTRHTSATVRCCAIQALSTRDGIDFYSIIMEHLDERTSVETLYGCLGGKREVREFFIWILKDKITPEQLKNIEKAQGE